jgi:hypothetical protein
MLQHQGQCVVQYHIGPNCWTLYLPQEHHHECSSLGYARELCVPTDVPEADSLIFQQDGAPAHFGAIVLTALDNFLVDGSAGGG